MRKWQMWFLIIALAFLTIAVALNSLAIKNLEEAIGFQLEVLEIQADQIREFDRKILFLRESVKDEREDIFSLIHASRKL